MHEVSTCLRKFLRVFLGLECDDDSKRKCEISGRNVSLHTRQSERNRG